MSATDKSVVVNANSVSIFDEETVSTLLERLDLVRSGVAIARNGEVVPKSQWAETEVRAGDVIEVLAPAAGG